MQTQTFQLHSRSALQFHLLFSFFVSWMGFRKRVFLLLFLVAGATATTTTTTAAGDYYVTWDDFKADFRRWDVGDGSRIIVVDQEGNGDSKTVQGAVDLVPENNEARVKILVYPGVYREKVKIPENRPYISLIGDEDDPSSVKITWSDKASDKSEHGGQIGTWNSASVTVLSDYFCAKGVTFENTVVQGFDRGTGYQAVAFRIGGDRAAFYRVRFLGYQDTLLDEKGSHYFLDCFIRGSTDFIFGNAKSLYKDCTISFVGNEFAVAAHHRNSPTEDTGFSFVNSTITGSGEVYLGRAWGNYSRIVYSHCRFNVRIRPGGWDDWSFPARQKTAVFGEYECSGIGADRSTRADWTKELSLTEATPFLTTTFIDGQQWLGLDGNVSELYL